MLIAWKVLNYHPIVNFPIKATHKAAQDAF